MKIIKIFNNNSIAALSDELGDIILTGSGIGFQKKIGDLVDESRIEKTYIFKEKVEKRIRRGINDIESIYYEITSLLVSKATEQLNTQFYGEIFLAISDHIAFAIKRKKEKIDLPNVVLSETKAIYKNEYQLGLWTIKLIKEKIGIQLEEAQKCWNASFKYVDHNSAIETQASDALRELSKHMINQNMDGRVTALQESVV